MLNDKIAVLLKLACRMKFGMVGELFVHFFNKSSVCCFGEPTFLIKKGEDTRWVRLHIRKKSIKSNGWY